jgi:cysteinyl-tRNA synthetase
MLRQTADIRKRFLDAMDDDFNTGGAVGVLFELLSALNKYIDDERLEAPGKQEETRLATLREGAATLAELAAILGLFRQPVETRLAGGDDTVGKLMQLVIELRADARKRKDFATADKIRNSLGELGIALEDRPSGTEWTKS